MLLKHYKSLMVSLENHKVCYLREKYCGIWKQEIFTEGYLGSNFWNQGKAQLILI